MSWQLLFSDQKVILVSNTFKTVMGTGLLEPQYGALYLTSVSFLVFCPYK